MSQPELLMYVVGLLTRLNIPYMVTGSVVSSLQGEPRATHDIDMVVVLQRSKVGMLWQAFTDDQLYSSELGMLEAIERQSMFNLIDSTSGNKVDFWMLTDDAFDLSRFDRRRPAPVFGTEAFYVTSAEDTIISKLRWAKLAGGSEKQLTDATRVFEMQFDRLDIAYIRHWVDALGLGAQWQQLVDQAEPY